MFFIVKQLTIELRKYKFSTGDEDIIALYGTRMFRRNPKFLEEQYLQFINEKFMNKYKKEYRLNDSQAAEIFHTALSNSHSSLAHPETPFDD